MRFLQYIKAALIFARHQAWVEQPLWEEGDAVAWSRFLNTPTGSRLTAMIRSQIVSQQSKAVSYSEPVRLTYEAGWCGGQKGLVASLEALADKAQFSDQGDTEANPDTHQAAS